MTFMKEQFLILKIFENLMFWTFQSLNLLISRSEK